MYTDSVTNLTGFYIDVWRKNGSNYDLVGSSNNISSSLVAGNYATIDLASPITGVQEGDYYGYHITATNSNPHFFARTSVSGVTSYYENGAVPSSTNYNWGAQLSMAGAVLPIELYMQAPQFAFIGDSIIAGHPAHYSFIETTATTNLASTIEYQFGALGPYTYQDMGIGGQTTTQITARFTNDIVNLHPTIAVIEGGVNDIAGGASKSTFISNWTTMLAAAQASSSIQNIMVLKILPWTNGTNTQMQTRDDWNASLVTLAASYPKAHVVDASSYVGQFRSGGDAGNLWDIKTAYNSDGVHFNQTGHGQIAQAIYDIIVAFNPRILTLSPANGVGGVVTSSNLVINFDQVVTAQTSGANTISIKKSSDNSTVETIAANSGQVTGSGTSTITITPTASFLASTGYYVQIGANAFQNSSAGAFTGISDTTTWRFAIGPPIVSTFSPANGATDVVANANLIITFSEAVTPQSSGANSITIKKSSDNSTVETIAANSGQVTGGGTSTITITPSSSFTYSTGYYIQIGTNAFKDAGSNAFAGITDTTTWNFTVYAGPTAGFGYYKTITVSNANMDATLTDFPLYVHLAADANIGAVARNDGYDILFTASDGTTILPYERESWTGGGGSAATADFWVKTTLNADNNTATTDTIRIYYGKASASDGQDTANVWDSSFNGVWHLASTSYLDSKSTNNGTVTGDVTNTTEKIYNGANFAGTNSSKISMTRQAGITYANPITVSFWAKNNTTETLKGVINVEYGGTEVMNGYYSTSYNGFLACRGNGAPVVDYTVKPSSAITQTNWNYFTIMDTGGDSPLTLYMNGVLNSNNPGAGALTGFGTNVVELGNGVDSTYHANMAADELRVSNIVRSAAWIKFDYHNQADSGNNLTFGGQTSTASTDATISAGTLASQTISGTFTGGANITASSALTVTVPDASKTNAALALTKGDAGSTINYVKGSQPANDAAYTGTYSAGSTQITVATNDIIWLLVTAADTSTKLYYKITVTVSPSIDATLNATTTTVKGVTLIGAGTPNSAIGSATGGTVTITAVEAADTSNAGSYITTFLATNAGATVKFVKYASGNATYSSTFAGDTAYTTAAITTGDFFIVRVIAADGSTTLYYKVTVTVSAATAKSITAFSFNGLSPTVTGIINGTAITATVPHGTTVTALVPTITITGSSVNPASGVAHDFSTNPQTYIVTAADTTQQSYAVTVTVAAATAPTISGVSSTPNSSGATITWMTNENASSKVDYGLTTSYGSSTTETDTSTRVTSHTVSLSGLSSCATYHYRVRSIDASLNETIDTDNNFTTSGCFASSSITATASEQIAATIGGTLTLEDGSSHGLTLTVPASFTGSDANFQAYQLDKTTVLATTASPTGYSVAGSYIYELKSLVDNTTAVSTFSNALTVSISYGASDIAGLDESTLKIYRYDGSSWSQLSGCVVDTSAKTVTCTTTNFSVFGLFGVVASSGGGGNIYIPAFTTIPPRTTPVLTPVSTPSIQNTITSEQRLLAIARIKQQLILLITQLIQMQKAGDNATSNQSLLETFTQALQYGSNNKQVVLLQDTLKKIGFLSQSIKSNGNFGPATLKAVQSFQVEYGIAKPGIIGYGQVGPNTRRKLNYLNP